MVRQALRIIQAVAESHTIIGADVVELSPIPGIVAPDYAAAQIAYQIIGLAHLKELQHHL